MKNIVLEQQEYSVMKDYREGFDAEAVKERFTDYFKPFDYIVGDWSYGKVRLKGFYKTGHANAKKMNDIANVDSYIKQSCAFDCRYFILEKK